jgi:hypothetical protein
MLLLRLDLISLLEVYDDLKGIRWMWHNHLTTYLSRHILGDMTGSNPKDRDKRGTKHHILTDQYDMQILAWYEDYNRYVG